MFCGFLIFISNIGNTKSYVRTANKKPQCFPEKEALRLFRLLLRLRAAKPVFEISVAERR